MPLGIITEDELTTELDRNNTSKQQEIPMVKPLPVPGRTNGKGNVPESLRKTIAEEHINGTGNGELAEIFNVSPSSVSAYANGATSTATYDKKNSELAGHIKSVSEKLAAKARKRLDAALAEITPERLKNAKIKDVSTIAKDMSIVVRNMEYKEKENDAPPVQFILYAPPIKKLDDFEIKQIGN